MTTRFRSFRRATWATAGALERAATRVIPSLTSSLTLPDALMIGGPQSASSWLHRQLAAVDGVFLPRRKEVRYFSQHRRYPLRWYAAFFASKGNDKAIDITPNYCGLSEERVREVHRLLGPVAIVVIARHPMDREWSAARRYLATRGLATGDLATDESAYLDWIRDRGRFIHSDPATYVPRWRRVFGDEAVLVVPFDDVITDPLGVIARVLDHIGVPTTTSVDLTTAAVNSNPVQAMTPRIAATLTAIYGDAVREALDRVPELPAAQWEQRSREIAALAEREA